MLSGVGAGGGGRGSAGGGRALRESLGRGARTPRGGRGRAGAVGRAADSSQASKQTGRSVEARLIVALLRAVFAERPCVVIIDDLHHVMLGPTWEVLEGLTQQSATEPPCALFVLATRPIRTWAAGGADARHAYAQLCSSVWTATLALPPLSELATASLVRDTLNATAAAGDSATLVAATKAQLRSVHAHCGGNPLFVKLTLAQVIAGDASNGACAGIATRLQQLHEAQQEMAAPAKLRAVAGQGVRKRNKLPAAITDIVLSQLDRLHFSEQHIVKMACALGQQFERSVLQSLFPGGAAELDEVRRQFRAATVIW